mmetsp:Transcript_16407/g.32577  ORF Transcript_16407/g.32577 Transcript_16407/m.32577 type:complete len:106 (-) Transcript_16407:993-1310(-)
MAAAAPVGASTKSLKGDQPTKRKRSEGGEVTPLVRKKPSPVNRGRTACVNSNETDGVTGTRHGRTAPALAETDAITPGTAPLPPDLVRKKPSPGESWTHRLCEFK